MDKQSFGESVVNSCSTRVDIERAMDGVVADHTSVSSLYRRRTRIYQRFDRAVSDFIIEGFELIRLAEAVKNATPAEATPEKVD